MLILLLTSAVVMLLMRASFFTYEYLTFRRETVRQLSAMGEIIATNSTAALAFDNRDDAGEILGALKANRHIVAAALYDSNGRFFAGYPANRPPAPFPAAPGGEGFHFEQSSLSGFQPVIQGERRLGTLYLQLDTGIVMREWLWVSLQIALALMAVIVGVAYLLSRSLQKQVSQPILALAETARAISERKDYSVRAVKSGSDEVGRLTDAFNQMLGEIQTLNRDLERRVAERTAQLETANIELNRSRAVFESLFESLPGLFLVLKPDFEIVTASDAYLKATMTTRDDVIGSKLFDLFPDHPEATDASGSSNLRTSLERVLATGTTDNMAIHKYAIRRPDGVFEERYWSTVNSPLLGVDRRVEYLIHRVEDVTDFVRQKPFTSGEPAELRIKMEQMEAEIFQSSQKIEASNLQLRSANAELEAFSYSVSHDLRAPLRHIDGFAGLLEKSDGKQLSERGRGHLAHISDSAKQMGALIDDLLVFSRMGRSEMNLGPVNLQQIAEETIQTLKKQELAERSVNWKLGSLPVVRGDRPMLRQVFVNLLSNAVKYSRPRDPAEIEVGVVDETDEWIIFVRDNGVGFEMQYAQKLFGVFQRLHRAEEFEGTGIGLANVRRIITRHGGRTWAESVLGQGATFYFSMPRNREIKS